MICQTIKRENCGSGALHKCYFAVKLPQTKEGFSRWQTCSCPVGRSWPDVALWVVVGLDVCESMKERQTDRERDGKQKEREGGSEGGMSCSPNYSARL